MEGEDQMLQKSKQF